MGTEITLEVNEIGLTYSKNARGVDHGFLFQEHDRKRPPSGQIESENNADSDKDPEETGFCRKLNQVVPRLELLGFTLSLAERDYLRSVEVWREEQESLRDDSEKPLRQIMSFAEFCTFATEHPIKDLANDYVDADDDDPLVLGRFHGKGLHQRLPLLFDHDRSFWSERSYFGSLLCFLHPYSALRVLAENAINLDADVTWLYGALVDNGWAREDEFTSGARRTQTFLIATEGSSDAYILERAFALLLPEIQDFFRFIDVSERHPFPGTGNLLKFAEGLAKIDVHNQIVFLFDNDAEGLATYQQLRKLSLPTNMRAIMLPDLEQFRSFPARGPSGVTHSDINGLAAAIECYLDLNVGNSSPPQVVWTNYKKELDAYHGALDHKEAYTKAFLKLTPATLVTNSYDVSKLHAVLTAIVAGCSSMASDSCTPDYLLLQ